MSWSVQGVGRAPAVRAAIAKQFSSQGKCSEPEETVRQAAISIIDAALSGQGPSVAVKVSASGSQGTSYPSNEVQNQLSITIEPLYGFVE
jgi:hypothetical protein